MQKRNKLLIGGLSTAAVVTGVALTGGTSAYYYDLERSEGNTFSACSLDLEETAVSVQQVAGDSQAVGSATNDAATSSRAEVGQLSTITLSNLQPGDQFRVRFDLTNTGTCAGELWGDVNFPIEDLENGYEEPELHAPDTDTVGGELDDLMLVEYRANGSSDPANNYFNGTYHDLAYKVPYMLDGNFTSGKTVPISVMLTVPGGDVAGEANEIMGDSFTFAIDFAAAQKGKLARDGNASDFGVGLDDLGVAP